MAEAGGAGGGGGAPPDVEWTFPGTLSGDQNANLYIFRARKPATFVKFDCQVVSNPSGQAIIVDWLKNGAVVLGARVTVPAGSDFAETVFTVSLVVDDKLQPQVSQVGSVATGTTMNMRARGS